MIVIENKQPYPEGEIWLSGHISEDWQKLCTTIPFFTHIDLGLSPGANPQRKSDLDIYTLPIHACKIPSAIFFPYVTYFAGTWFTKDPSFVIPNQPLNRLDGRNWLDTGHLAFSPFNLVQPQFPDIGVAWVEPRGKIRPETTTSFTEISRLAFAAKMYMLDEIRYVYDGNNSILDSQKNNVPSRHKFDAELAKVENTKEYLEWYIASFRVFFHRLVQTAGQDDKTLRKQFLISSWTLNRLAVDVLAISLIDVPYIRKWQFFGLVDASASLINELTLPDKLKKGTQRMARDRDMAEKLLTRDWFQTELKPVLEQISVAAIREEIITHTETTYEAIEAMEIKTRKANATGQQLLRAYRNSRHGYAINDREILLLHSGKIHDDIPDISIALWHYLLLKFPFSSVTK